MSFSEYPVHVDQLCVGVFVRIDEAKAKLPFARKSFMIKSEKDIEKIRSAGLKYVTAVLSKSDRMPTSLVSEELQKPQPKEKPGLPKMKTPVSKELLGLKKETLEKNKERRKKFARCETRYNTTVNQVVTLLRRVSGRSAEAVDEAELVVDNMVGTFLSEHDVVVNLMSTKPTEARQHYHALNVSVLALMLGKELGLNSETMHYLGMGALFHDLGKGRMPITEMRQGTATAMRYAVRKHYQLHPRIGAKIASEMDNFPKQAIHIIMQHHEMIDGKGFPSGLARDRISPLAKIVSVVNVYDNMVNKDDPKQSLTPHDALKEMFSKMRHQLDNKFLTMFIQNIGVYPPGTVVQLSNGSVGTVISTNPQKSVRPSVLIYHPEIPKKEALIIDLAIETDLEIKKAIPPDELSREIFTYLSPSRQVNYYADAAK